MTQIPQLNYGEKKNDMIINLGTTIKELLAENLISVRTYNVCYSNKLFTVEEIKNFHDTTPNSFLNLKNCGRKSTLELYSVIKEIKPEVIEVSEAVEVDEFDTVNQIIRQTFIDEYELFVNDPCIDEDIVTLFKTKFPNPSSLFNKSIYNTTKLLSDISGNGKLVYCFREQLISIISDISKQLEHKLPDSDEFAINIAHISKLLKETLKNDYLVDFCKYKLSNTKRQFLENEYSRLIDASSTMAQKLANMYICTIYELIPLIYLSKDSFVLKFGGKKKSALDYYNYILAPFLQIFERILYGDVDEEALDIYIHFPFLTSESIEWVKTFYKNNSYYPMFFIVCEFLRNSNIREYEMFCLKFGLNNTQKLYSFAEIAQKFDLNKERVRQILNQQNLRKEPIAHSNFWKHYFAQDLVLITDTSMIFKEICSSEKLFIHFDTFAEICNIIFKFKFINMIGCKFCCPEMYFSTINTILKKLFELKRKKYSEETIYKVNEIISKEALDIPGIEDAIFSIIIPTLHINVTNDSLYFKKNFVDIEKEAYNILYQKGEPMHIDELVSRIKNNNIQFKLNKNTIKNKIYKSKKIFFIGKTSMCKLEHWRNIFGGSIRDLLRKILNERETPVHLDELTSLVTDIFEKTNRNSINTSLLNSNEFIYFNNGYFGLQSKTYPPQYIESNAFKQRLSFDERFKNFKEFVNTYLRIPYSSGAEDENSLCRWYHNVQNGNIDTTEEQRRILNEFVDSNKELPQNGKEIRFKKLCQEYLDYVKSYYELPNYKKGATLYNWIKKNLSNYLSYNDNRKLYFTKLIKELEDYGFKIR